MPAFSTAERKTLASSAVKRRQVGRLVRRLHPAGLDAREVEQGIDELLKPKRVAMEHFEPFALLRGSLPRRARPRPGRA